MNLYPHPDLARKKTWPVPAPPWRKPRTSEAARDRVPPLSPAERERATAYVRVGGQGLIDAVNAALLLRRPLLVRGEPGYGKSSLALHLAHTLGLGHLLRWEINSRTTLEEGLYHYDAVGHLGAPGSSIDDYITLGPLGTALVPTARPRVLLIDELDKASYDLPNDLLHVFEEGHFRIPELRRKDGPATVYPADPIDAGDRVRVPSGVVEVHHHPVVVVTTNDEREFPPAFLRRVVSFDLPAPSTDELEAILRAWFGDRVEEARAALAGSAGSTAVRLQLAQLGLGGFTPEAARAVLLGDPK